MSQLTNCPNCGAVITGPKCEYCGTHFPFKKAEAEIVELKLNTASLESQMAQRAFYEHMLGLITPYEARRRFGL